MDESAGLGEKKVGIVMVRMRGEGEGRGMRREGRGGRRDEEDDE